MLKLLRVLFLQPGPRYTWKKVVLILFLSCCVISGSATVGYIFYRYATHWQMTNEACLIQALVQTTSYHNPLQTTYLAEVLELSSDTPQYLSTFDIEEGNVRLLATQIIKKAHLKKIKPNILYVEYSLREPIAFLEDYTNTAIDLQGTFFPFTPFYSPSYLPKIYLGEHAPPDPWGESMKTEHIELVTKILQKIEPSQVERIDLSQIEADSAGKRELVVILKGGSILRLTPKNYIQELTNYSILEQNLLQDKANQYIVDLRIPEVAYLERF